MISSAFHGITFAELFKQAGVVEQRDEAKVFRLEEPVFVREGDATLVALPTDKDGLTLQYVAAFDEPGVDGGSFQVRVDPGAFEHEIGKKTKDEDVFFNL